MAQRLQTQLILDAALSNGFESTFASANKLLADVKKESKALERELKDLGKEADELDKLGEGSEDLRTDMRKLEKQIKSANRAVDKFGDSKRHFRNAKIGAANFKSEIGDIVGAASKAALGVAAIGTAAVVGLKPPPELQEFDAALTGIRRISIGVDEATFDAAKSQILDLSNFYGVQASEIAMQFQQLTRSLGFEGATESIQAAIEFQTQTGLGIPDIEEELATARISLGVDTAGELQSFLGLLQRAYAVGIKIDNLDLGDLETLTARVGTDLESENFQREFLTTIAFRQVDSFQFADYAAAFKEEIERATFISPEMDFKEIEKATKAIAALEKYGIRAEDGLTGAMRVYQNLSEVERVAFFTELEPVLTAMPAEVIARGSEALPQIEQQVELALDASGKLAETMDAIEAPWSRTWQRIGTIGANTMGILQERFAEVFGPPVVAAAERLFNFISAHEAEIKNFFTGIRDGITPIIQKIGGGIRAVWPDVREFASKVWVELKGYWDAIAPTAAFFVDKILGLAKAVGGFLKEHPKLVATVLVGAAAWKTYKIASGGVQAVFDGIAGLSSLAQGHFHKLTAEAIGNQRQLQNLGGTATTTGQKFLGMGKDMLATKFPRMTSLISGIGGVGKAAIGAVPSIAVMGAGLWTALAPALPFIAAGAAIAGVGVLIYKNWEPLKAFFVDNFETIRNAALIIFPPLGVLIGLAGVIKDNWEPLKAFFAEVWETITLTGQVAWEGIKFVALSAVKFVQETWSGITGFFSEVWSGVQGIFLDSPLAPIFEFMVQGIVAVVSPLTDFFSDIWGSISEKAGGVLRWITGKFESLNETLDKWFGWLRKRNKELSDEISGMQMEVIHESTPITAPGRLGANEKQIKGEGIHESTDKSIHESTQINTNEKQIAPEAIETNIAVDPLSDLNVTVDELKAMGVQEIDLSELGSVEVIRESALINADEKQIVPAPMVETEPPINYVDVPQAVVSEATERDDEPVEVVVESGDGETSRTTNNFTFNVYQQPGEDSDELARKIARIVDEQVNGSRERFLAQ